MNISSKNIVARLYGFFFRRSGQSHMSLPPENGGDRTSGEGIAGEGSRRCYMPPAMEEIGYRYIRECAGDSGEPENPFERGDNGGKIIEAPELKR